MTKLIDVKKIIGGSNVRNEHDDSLFELAQSINSNGLLQPITVRQIGNDQYEIINGHRRFEAIKLNNEPYIECNILDVSDKDRFILQVVENVHRKNMSAYELVKAFNEMKEKYNCTNKAIGRYFNKTEQWVNDNYCAIRLLEKEYAEGIPEEKKKLSYGVIKAQVTNKRKGNSVSIECEGMNVKKRGHSYIIYCNNFETENKLNQFIDSLKTSDWR